MSIVFWIVSALVALVFLSSGMMKLTQQKEKMSVQMKWVEDFDQNTIRGIGALEVLGRYRSDPAACTSRSALALEPRCHRNLDHDWWRGCSPAPQRTHRAKRRAWLTQRRCFVR
jgi:hypothetical protein